MDINLMKDIKKTENIIKLYFPHNKKLYSLEDEEINRSTIDIDEREIMHIFNNRSWLQVWHDFNYLEINGKIHSSWVFISYAIEIYYSKKNIPIPKYETIEEDFIFYFTGLFFLGDILEEINNDGWGTIIDFLDPKSSSDETILIKNPNIKPYFPFLIEKYNEEQLYLLSLLFVHLTDSVPYAVSSLGKKYWKWIYDNTDDEIRNKIFREFEEA